MSDSWDEMKRAKEDSYFEEENKRALERLKDRESHKPRLSPVTGKPMEHVTYMGVLIDRCKDTGGIWVDKGELEQILKAATGEAHEKVSWFEDFFGLVSKHK